MANPYQPYADIPAEGRSLGELEVHQVEVRAFSRLQDARRLMGEQYFLFVGICGVMLLLNAGTMNLLLGTLICGLHVCYRDRQSPGTTSFARLFKGFDHFLPSFLATLVMLLGNFVIAGGAILATLLPFFLVRNAPGVQREPAILLLLTIATVFSIFSIVIYAPFVFVFALIADRNLPVLDALLASYRGAVKNFRGILWMFLIYGLLAILCSMLCYLPLFFLLPLQFGAVFLFYQDVYENRGLPC